MNIKSDIATSDKSIVNPIIVNGEIVGYLPLEIPDKTTGEIERIYRDNQIREYNETREYRKEREKTKKARILSSKEDKYLNAIDLIIEHAGAQNNNKNIIENGNNPSNFIIPEYDFNFENSKLLTSFFEKLKDNGCFKNWTTNPFRNADYGEFIFSEVNTSCLSRFRNLIKKKTSILGKFTKQEISEIIKICSLIGKERKLIEELSDAKSHKFQDLKINVNTTAISQLKSTVNRKIRKLDWEITTFKKDGYNIKDSSYQLQKLI